MSDPHDPTTKSVLHLIDALNVAELIERDESIMIDEAVEMARWAIRSPEGRAMAASGPTDRAALERVSLTPALIALAALAQNIVLVRHVLALERELVELRAMAEIPIGSQETP